jgi:adenosylcobinamide-GDP ribazoletransferase
MSGATVTRTFLVALQMMTRVPVRLAEAPSEREQGLAAAWFPLVGAGVGCVAAVAYWALWRAHLPSLAPWAALAATVALTGAFHEDGLADTADGIFGSSDRARRLEIMRDSRVGSYGVVALVLVLGAQVSAVGALPPALGWRALIAAHALGRAAALPLSRLPYARAEGGLGHAVAERRVPAWALAVALVTGVAPLALLPWPLALGAAGAAGLVTLVAGARFKRDLGGITGDALGAVVKLAELATYVAAAAWAARP